MLGLSFNSLTVDHLYSCHDRQKLPQQFPTQLSSKPKTFSEAFMSFLKYAYSFEHFSKKDHLHNFSIARVSDSKKYGSLNAQRLVFENTLWKLMCYGIPNTAAICTTVLSC